MQPRQIDQNRNKFVRHVVRRGKLADEGTKVLCRTDSGWKDSCNGKKARCSYQGVVQYDFCLAYTYPHVYLPNFLHNTSIDR